MADFSISPDLPMPLLFTARIWAEKLTRQTEKVG